MFDVGQPVGCGRPAGERRLRVRAQGTASRSVEGPAALTPARRPIDPDDPGMRMNDGACDSQGRFWAGTMRSRKRTGAGALYRLDADGTARRWSTTCRSRTESRGASTTRRCTTSTRRPTGSTRSTSSRRPDDRLPPPPRHDRGGRRRPGRADRRCRGLYLGGALERLGGAPLCARRHAPGDDRRARCPPDKARVRRARPGRSYITSAERGESDDSEPHAGGLFRAGRVCTACRRARTRVKRASRRSR